MQREKFETLVVKAINALPLKFQQKLENVDIVVEDYPKTSDRMHLLGLYEGIPQTKRSAHYGMVIPDKITIFQKPIEAITHTNGEIETEIKKVVRHEIAHHFGSSEETLHTLESD
jgi:predicted Zn-dependent protease with MMP-like domain